jgi:hypothetical protein
MASKRTAAVWLIGVASALILLSSVAHGFLGWPAVRAAIEPRLEAEALRDLALGWTYGSTAMAAFGVLGLVSVVQLRKGASTARVIPAVIGAAYALYGVAALVYSGGNAHFLIAFILPGVLLLAGALLARARRLSP